MIEQRILNMPPTHLLRRLLGATFAVTLALGVSACDVGELLNVEAPDRIPAEGLATPQNAELLVNGAIGDFECAFNGYVGLSAIMAGEMTDATQTAARWPADRRNLNPQDAQYSTWDCGGLGVYVPLSRARWSADNILEKLQDWTDAQLDEFGFDRQELIAKAAAYAGYSYVLLGEGFCSMAIDLSEEMTPAEIFQIAVNRFTTAIAAAQAAGDTDLENMALLGRARAYINLGQGSNAVTDAQNIPAGFEYAVTASDATGRRNNQIFGYNGPPPLGGSSMSVGENYRTFTHMGQPDPRVSSSGFIRVNSDGTDLYYQQKYTSLGDPLVLASYDEAQLIIAEVQLGATAVAIINDFHTAAGLPAYGGGTDAEILDHVIEERRAELWLEGHRFNDIERFNLTLDPPPGTPHRKGGTYGDDRCFPLPDVEVRNNPNI